MTSHKIKCSVRSKCIDSLNANLIENLKQFRANPVPVQTFIPLYQTMVKQQCLKSEVSSVLRKTQLAMEQKPFHFNQMNYEKKSYSGEKLSGSQDDLCIVDVGSTNDKLNMDIPLPTKLNAHRTSSAQFRSRSCSRTRTRLISPKMTRATLLRNTFCKSRNITNETAMDNSQTGAFDVKKVLSKKISVTDGRQMFAERLKSARIGQKVQLMEYEKQKEEMYERVKNRPLLVERQIQQAVLSKLQKDYHDILKKEGLSADIIMKNSGKGKSSSTIVQTDEEESYESSESGVSHEDSQDVSQSSVSRRSETYSHDTHTESNAK